MKVVILAGGLGTRISEESHLRPKPMVEIGDKPILWHIMKQYAYYGFSDFVICAGYKQHVIKEWFADYYLHNTDITFHLSDNSIEVHNTHAESWNVTVVDTGLNTMTGGRVKRVAKYLDNEPFFLTYGDGVSDINIGELLKFHQSHGKLMTISSFNIGQQFGVLDIAEDGSITGFREKSTVDGNRINIGFMVCQPNVLEYIQDDSTILERTPIENLSRDGQLMSCFHNGFWQCMDTIRDHQKLEKMWESQEALWKIWDDQEC